MSPFVRMIIMLVAALVALAAGYVAWYAGFLGWVPGARLSFSNRVLLAAAGFVLAIPWAILMVGFMQEFSDASSSVTLIMRLRRYVVGAGMALLAFISMQTNTDPFSPFTGWAVVGVGLFAGGFVLNVYLAQHMLRIARSA